MERFELEGNNLFAGNEYDPVKGDWIRFFLQLILVVSKAVVAALGSFVDNSTNAGQ